MHFLRKVQSHDTFQTITLTMHGKQPSESEDFLAASKFSRLRRHGKGPWRRPRSSSSLSLLADHHHSSSESARDHHEVDETTAIGIMTKFRKRKQAIGYITMFLLGIMTASNLFVENVDAAEHKHKLYSAKSSAPTIQADTASRIDAPRLGTAAISSVTELLSPILPFTGGLDLRREWEITKSVSYVIDQTKEAFGFVPRGGHQSDNSIVGGSGSYKQQAKVIKTKHISTLSLATPFVPIKKIAEMTLEDLTTIFQHSMAVHRDDSSKKLLTKQNQHLVPILAQLDAAVATSRGKGVEPAKSFVPEKGLGEMDALQFCASMRLFAEWRLVRQVPDGYKGYAVGMNLGFKDIVQNVGKMETAVHQWIDHRRGLLELQATWDDSSSSSSTADTTLRSPTLRDLLEYEIDMESHGNRLPRLKDKTAAMGLLWVRRQLHYQTALFANVVQVPSRFPTAIPAISAAYEEVYGKYHGWAVQKIFNYSFQAAPEVEVIYKYMNPKHLEEVMEEARKMKSSLSIGNDAKDHDDVDDSDNDTVATEASEDCDNDNDTKSDLNPFQQFGHHIASEWDKLGKHIGGEWDKLVGLFDNNKKDQPASHTTKTTTTGLAGQELEDFLIEKMSALAKEQILGYVDKIQPLLDDITNLFEELNMEDPTKV